MMQRYDLCRIQKTAQLLVLSHEKFIPLSASAEVLTKLIGDEINEKFLLSLPVFASIIQMKKQFFPLLTCTDQ